MFAQARGRLCLSEADSLLKGIALELSSGLNQPVAPPGAMEGGKSYRLRVPANVPVREFWSATVYSLRTSSFFLNATRLTLGSLDKELRKNADGTVDIYFGPRPPAGQASNWLYTQPGEKWFQWFRVYGPEKAIFDKSWRLPDIEMIS